MGLPRPTLYGPELDAWGAFSLFTHADVLILGTSGFSRLGALLAPNTTVCVFPPFSGIPMPELAHFTQWPWNNDVADNISVSVEDAIIPKLAWLLGKNTALQRLMQTFGS